jgi:protein phosphatase
MDAAGLWDELQSDWVLLDAEIMPWSLKANALVLGQYAPVGAAATVGLADEKALLEAAAARGVPVGTLAENAGERLRRAAAYREAYGRYAWPFSGIDDLRIAPFHILATEGAVHSDKNHEWHMGLAHRLAATDPALLLATDFRMVDLSDPEQLTAAVAWWETKTGQGGEGMVVKPLDFVARGKKGLLQPAIKCRGREYLRIIYGPEYDLPENLGRLKARGLGAKRALAFREFALGLEALHRFVEHQPLTRVHQCVFGVLAMESEPVDPRL